MGRLKRSRVAPGAAIGAALWLTFACGGGGGPAVQKDFFKTTAQVNSGPVLSTPAPPGVASGLAVEPTSLGNGLAPFNVTVRIVDSQGATVATSTAVVTLSLANTTNGLTLLGVTSVAAVDGVATFQDLRLSGLPPAGLSLVATATGLIQGTNTRLVLGVRLAQPAPQAPRAFLSVSQPQGLAVVDLNGDGLADVVGGDGNGDFVFLRPGRADGSLGPLSTLFGHPSFHLADLQVADLDGKNGPDLAALFAGSEGAGQPPQLAVLLNDGHGKLGPGDSVPEANQLLDLPRTPRDLAAGDLDGDGDLDVAIALDGEGGRGFLALINDGAGHFAQGPLHSVDNFAQAVAVGPLDRRPGNDVVLTQDVGQVAIFSNDGHGAFGAANYQFVGTSAADVLLADVDRKNGLDVVVSDPASASVSTLLNDGQDGFDVLNQTPLLLAGGRRLAAGDFDRKNGPDVAVVDSFSRAMNVLVNKGDGTFEDPVLFDSGQVTFVAAGDIRGLGVTDLVTASFLDGDLSVYLNSAGVVAAPFPGPLSASVAGPTRAVAVADFNRDGRPDVAVSDGTAHVSVLPNAGNLTFDTAVDVSTGLNPSVLASRDWDARNGPDLAVLNQGAHTVTVHFNNGSGQFGASPLVLSQPPGQTQVSLTTGDFDGDHRPDLAVLSSALLRVYRNNGVDFDAPVELTPASNPADLRAADLDGDGRDEIVLAVARAAQIVRVSPSFQLTAQSVDASRAFSNAGFGPFSLQLGDLDQDGRPDLLLAGAQRVLALFNDGAGAFDAGRGARFQPRDVRAASLVDVNADGRPDVILSGQPGPFFQVFLNQTGGTFAAAQDYTVPRPGEIVGADLDGDGTTELIVPSTQVSGRLLIIPTRVLAAPGGGTGPVGG